MRREMQKRSAQKFWNQSITDKHTDKLIKDMERERGRKSYFVHNMRHDVAILC